MHSCLPHGPPQVWRAHFSTLPSITAASLRTPALQDPQRAALPAMMLHRCWRHKKMRIGNICSYCRIVACFIDSSSSLAPAAKLRWWRRGRAVLCSCGPWCSCGIRSCANTHRQLPSRQQVGAVHEALKNQSQSRSLCRLLS